MFERTKINEREAGVGPFFFKKKIQLTSNKIVLTINRHFNGGDDGLVASRR